MKKQRIILQGVDADQNKHLPKVLNECLKRISTLIKTEGDVVPLFQSEDNILHPIPKIDKENIAATLKSYHPSVFKPDLISSQSKKFEEGGPP